MELRTLIRGAVVAAAALAALAPLRAFAEYPDHPVILIVPTAAGGSLDILARVMAPFLSKDLGQPVVVENKPGADALIGIGYVVGARPDGYTILLSGGAETIAPALHSSLNYDPAQLAAISEFAFTPNVIAVNSKLGAKTLADLIDLARKSPGKLNAAATGNGSRLSEALFGLKTGTQFTVVSFAGGAPAMTSMLGGETDFTVQDSLAFAGGAGSSGIQVLAVADAKRLEQMPNVPTTSEAGLPDFTVGTRYGIYTTAKVPNAILQKLNAEMAHISTIPAVIDQFHKLNLQIYSKSVEDSQASYLSQIAAWKTVVQQAHVPMTN